MKKYCYKHYSWSNSYDWLLIESCKPNSNSFLSFFRYVLNISDQKTRQKKHIPRPSSIHMFDYPDHTMSR